MQLLVFVNNSNKPLINIPENAAAFNDINALKQEIARQIEWQGGDFSLQIYVPDFADFANLSNIGMIADKCKIKVYFTFET